MSAAEEQFAQHCAIYQIPVEREYRFHPTRRWRFDFYPQSHRIAVEIEGGTWNGGRHTRGGGFAADCEKYNAATMMGYRIFRFTSSMVVSGIAIDTIVAATSVSPATAAICE